MGLVEGTYYRLTCDECGDPDGFTAEGYGYMVVESIEEGHQMVRDSEGRVDDDGRITCAACIESAEYEREATADA